MSYDSECIWNKLKLMLSSNRGRDMSGSITAGWLNLTTAGLSNRKGLTNLCVNSPVNHPQMQMTLKEKL